MLQKLLIFTNVVLAFVMVFKFVAGADIVFLVFGIGNFCAAAFLLGVTVEGKNS